MTWCQYNQVANQLYWCAHRQTSCYPWFLFVRPCRCVPLLPLWLLAQPIIGIHFPLLIPPPYISPRSFDRGLWVKRWGERSITTRFDPIKYRFNQPHARPVNRKYNHAAGNRWSPARTPVPRLGRTIGLGSEQFPGPCLSCESASAPVSTDRV